jgi:hypothetical protein
MVAETTAFEFMFMMPLLARLACLDLPRYVQIVQESDEASQKG